MPHRINKSIPHSDHVLVAVRHDCFGGRMTRFKAQVGLKAYLLELPVQYVWVDPRNAVIS